MQGWVCNEPRHARQLSTPLLAFYPSSRCYSSHVHLLTWLKGVEAIKVKPHSPSAQVNYGIWQIRSPATGIGPQRPARNCAALARVKHAQTDHIRAERVSSHSGTHELYDLVTAVPVQQRPPSDWALLDNTSHALFG